MVTKDARLEQAFERTGYGTKSEHEARICSSWLERAHIQPNEFMQLAITGTGWLDGKRTECLLLATSDRLLCLNGRSLAEIEYQQVTGVEHREGWANGSLTVRYGASGLTVRGVTNAALEPMSRFISDQSRATRMSDPGSRALGVVDELERLASLHERGLITADEYEAGKRRVLQG